ncbi:MAG: type II toxin-antitoxin system RelE/ParE family toxin [Burkholderiales bacterium]|nr:type II toxin-antitoxin system RelE/ParE family toxin [Burkholderiales bacterium]
MIPVQFHDEAQAEFVAAALFYEEQVAGLGTSFATEIKKSLSFIQAYPEASPRLGTLLRKFVVKRFPYTIIYRHEEQWILILAIAHDRRRPGYWNRRQTR